MRLVWKVFSRFVTAMDGLSGELETSELVVEGLYRSKREEER